MMPTNKHMQIQILVDEPANELMEYYDVANCNSFIYYPAGTALESKGYRVQPNQLAQLEDWFWEFHKIPGFPLQNDLDVPVEVYWESKDTLEERDVMLLEPSEEKPFRTYLGHTLVFRSPQEGNKILARAIITSDKGFVLSSLLQGPGNREELQLTEHEVSIWRGRRRTNLSRTRQNERQPPLVHPFTDVGFKRLKIPKQTYQKLLAFHQDHEALRAREGWHEDDLHVNFYDVMTTIVHLDQKHRDLVFNTLQPILEAWVGGEKLEPTSTYGIRRYYNGSVLRDHVDIGETHIVSAILNIAQDVDKVWPLQILDHDGRRHYVEMAAGDMVLYESAVCIHGRSQPMFGRSYDNIFTHFVSIFFPLFAFAQMGCASFILTIHVILQ